MYTQPRYLSLVIPEDALKDKKMAFVSGPSQVGKTTLGEQFLLSKNNHFSWDEMTFRRQWSRQPEEALRDIDEGPILLDASS